MSRLLVLFSGLMLACEGKIQTTSSSPNGAGGTDGGARQPDVDPLGCLPPDQLTEARRIFEGLKAPCAGCHGLGTNTPIFSSESAFFQNALANSALVTPGNPDQSELIRLLRGTGTRYPRMPLGTKTYQQLVEAKEASISIAEVEGVIAKFAPCGGGSSAVSPTARRLRRLSLSQLIASLHQQLGLEPKDFVDPESGSKVEAGADLILYLPDGNQRFVDGYPYNFALERALSLGGRHALDSVSFKTEVTPAFVQQLNQVAPNWCRKAMSKPNCPLFRFAAKTDGSDQTAKVKQNLKFMYLSMLSVEATDAQVDRLYDSVFVPIAASTETQEQTLAAWVGVCAALVRHPLWISF